ncbi:hypothetical protein M0P98_02015 [bacterium]|nr:hypothetical protein [bacterium]
MRRNSFLIKRTIFFLLFLHTSLTLQACGPYFPTFVSNTEGIFEVHKPHYYKSDFSGTSPGILSPNWQISSLYQAYKGLTTGNIEIPKPEVYSFWSNEKPLSNSEPLSPEAEWREARKKITTKDVRIDKWHQGAFFDYFYNIGDDAFYTATKTLNQRIKIYSKEEIEIWLDGQDAVFGDGRLEPFEKTLDMNIKNPLLKQDREYQRAAACFYSGKYEEAEKRFREISKNQQHPWRDYSALAVGRTLLRRAHFEGDLVLKNIKDRRTSINKSNKVKQKWMKKANRQFENILRDKTLKSVHPSAKNLIGYVNFRIAPYERMLDTEKELLSALSYSENLRLNIYDFTQLYNRFKKNDTNFIMRRGGDFSRWLLSFQTEYEEKTGHSASVYLREKSLPWLIVALKHLRPYDTSKTEIIQSAYRIKEDSPAYFSVMYYLLLYKVKYEKNREEIKNELESLLKGLNDKKDWALWDSFMDLRAQVSSNMEDALNHSLRKTHLVYYEESCYSIAPGQEVVLDNKVKDFFNIYLPLNRWVEVSLNDNLFTPNIREQIRFATFLRSVLLDDISATEKVALKLSETDIRLKKDLNRFLKSRNLEEKKFEAVFFILKYLRINTHLDSYTDEIIIEKIKMNEMDNFRRHWWGKPILGVGGGFRKLNESKYGFPKIKYMLDFLSETDIKKAKEENKLILSLIAPNYLSNAVIEYAKKNPNNKRVPESLHLAVRSTRYPRSKNLKTGDYSREAFQLLHKRYPNSSWAKKTPYWYK